MGMVRVVSRAGLRKAVRTTGRLIGCSVRDGCIAMTVLVAWSYHDADAASVQGLAGLAALIGADPTDAAVEAMARVALFGGMVLESVYPAKIVAVLSVPTNAIWMATKARRDARKASTVQAQDREAGNG